MAPARHAVKPRTGSERNISIRGSLIQGLHGHRRALDYESTFQWVAACKPVPRRFFVCADHAHSLCHITTTDSIVADETIPIPIRFELHWTLRSFLLEPAFVKGTRLIHPLHLCPALLLKARNHPAKGGCRERPNWCILDVDESTAALPGQSRQCLGKLTQRCMHGACAYLGAWRADCPSLEGFRLATRRDRAWVSAMSAID